MHLKRHARAVAFGSDMRERRYLDMDTRCPFDGPMFNASSLLDCHDATGLWHTGCRALKSREGVSPLDAN